MLRGIDQKTRLAAFFKAKNHRNLVLRVVDLIRLIQDDQQWMIHFLVKCLSYSEATPQGDNWRKQWFKRNFPTGYIVIPVDAVLQHYSLQELARLQQIVHAVAELRFSDGAITRRETCEKCQGTGCSWCGQTGVVETFLEVDATEQALAEGVSSPHEHAQQQAK